MSGSKPSEYIRRHLAGGAHDLDDLLSIHDRHPGCRDVIEEVLAISRRHTTPDCPIGVGNADSSLELSALAERLETSGR